MRRRRGPGAFRAAFPGRLARQHKARWFAARDALNKIRVRPAAREVLRVLIDFMGLRPQLRDVMIGYGGCKDANHRRQLEEKAARGIPVTKGLAELSGMCRSSMVRGVRALVAEGVVVYKPGRGRGNANPYQLAPALCGDLPLPEPPPAPVEQDQAQPREGRPPPAAWQAARARLESRGPPA